MRTLRSARRLARIAMAVAAGGLAVSSLAWGAQAAAKAWTRSDAAAAAVRDLASRLKLDEARVRVVTASDETWSDATFGCTGRKPLTEPVPVPGYAFTLAVDGRQYRYRSDRVGTLRRCDGVKPVAPIERHR